VGLAGYGPAEEAFGVLLGNAGRSTYHWLNSLIPLAVIDFAARPEQPSFRQVFEFSRALIVCLANPSESELERRQFEFARAAFSRTIRVLRLGKGGVVERSTTKYWYGLLLLARYFDARGVSNDVIEEFLLGKYDCHNPAQLELLRHHRRP